MTAVRMSALAKPRERGTMAEAIAIIGYKERVIQAMAAAGKIPGAAKLAGSRCWTFDLAMLRRWVKDEETKQWDADGPRRGATGAGRSCGAEPRSPAGNTDGAYAQAMSRLQNGGARRRANA